MIYSAMLFTVPVITIGASFAQIEGGRNDVGEK
jgi:hypothetical protein